MTERSVEDFLFGREVDIREASPPPPAEPPPDAVRAAVEREAARQAALAAGPQQITIEGTEEPVAKRPDLLALADVVGVIYKSRHGGPPHVVTVFDLGQPHRVVSCTTCEAIKSIAKRPNGCWAARGMRALLAIPDPEPF